MAVALPAIGKISPEVFAHHILPFLGAKNAAVRVGPQSGVDEGIAARVGGETLPAGRGVTVTGPKGRDRPLVRPRVDPFGAAFGRAAAESAEASKGM